MNRVNEFFDWLILESSCLLSAKEPILEKCEKLENYNQSLCLQKDMQQESMIPLLSFSYDLHARYSDMVPHSEIFKLNWQTNTKKVHLSYFSDRHSGLSLEIGNCLISISSSCKTNNYQHDKTVQSISQLHLN